MKREAHTSITTAQIELRQELERIVTTEIVRVHERLIVNLAVKYPSAHLVVVPPDPSCDHAYNCFMHALHLVGRLQPNVVQTQADEIRFLVDSVFFRKLFETGLLEEIPESMLQPNDLIVYYKSRHKRHVGRYLAPDLIESKWGIGPLMQHGLWDVPLSYGQRLRCFKPANQALVDAFVKQQLPFVDLATPRHL
jgi:hypothetical protein